MAGLGAWLLPSHHLPRVVGCVVRALILSADGGLFEGDTRCVAAVVWPGLEAWRGDRVRGGVLSRCPRLTSRALLAPLSVLSALGRGTLHQQRCRLTSPWTSPLQG